MPPGTYAFTAWAGGPGESLWPPDFVPGSADGPDPEGEALYRSQPLTFTVEDGGGDRLEFRLEPRPGVHVSLSYEGAHRPRSVRIAVVHLEDAPIGDPAALLAAKGVRERWLDGSSEAAISGLDPGNYLVGATFRGGKIGATATVVVGKGLAPVALRVSDIDPMDWIRVRVLDPDGLPMPDVHLECGCRGSEWSDTVKVGTVPGADGFFHVEHYAKGASVRGGGWTYSMDIGDGPFTYFVRATRARFGTSSATYDPAIDREVTLRFAAPALLRVQVPGFAANPHRDRAVLDLSWEGEDHRPDQEGTIDATGLARYPPASPGRYELTLRLAAGSNPEDRRTAGWTGMTVARIPLALPSGETTVSVPLPVYSDLTVTFEGDAPRLQRLGPDGVPAREEAGRTEEGAGAVTFRDLPEGRYRLRDVRRGAMWVDLPMSGPLAFQPNPFNSFLLEVTGAGYVRDLGLRTGDLVVMIEGLEFKDRASMEKALATALLRGTARLTIQRDRAVFDVSADVRKFQEDKGSGYELWVR